MDLSLWTLQRSTLTPNHSRQLTPTNIIIISLLFLVIQNRNNDNSCCYCNSQLTSMVLCNGPLHPFRSLLTFNHNPPTITLTTTSENRKQKSKPKQTTKNERSVQTKAHILGLLSSPTPSIGLFACQPISGIYHAGRTLSTICHFFCFFLHVFFFGFDVVRR